MNITVTLTNAPVVVPPPTRVQLALDLSLQEAKLLRAILGNTEADIVSNVIATATVVPPNDQTTDTVKRQGRALGQEIATALRLRLENVQS